MENKREREERKADHEKRNSLLNPSSQEDPDIILAGAGAGAGTSASSSAAASPSSSSLAAPSPSPMSPEEKKDSWFQLVKQGQRMGMSEIKMRAKAMLQRKHEAEMYKSRVLKEKLFGVGSAGEDGEVREGAREKRQRSREISFES